MRIVHASDDKIDLPRLLDEIEEGETILIARHGKTVARIIPESGIHTQSRRQSIDALKGLRGTLPHASLDELLSFRHEGHRY